MSSALRGLVQESKPSTFIGAVCGSLPHAKIKPEHCVGPFFLGYVTALSMSRGDRAFEISLVASVAITLIANAVISGSAMECCEGKVTVLMIPYIQVGVVACGTLLAVARHEYHIRRGDFSVLDEGRRRIEVRRSEAYLSAMALERQEHIKLARFGVCLALMLGFTQVITEMNCFKK